MCTNFSAKVKEACITSTCKQSDNKKKIILNKPHTDTKLTEIKTTVK